MRKTKRLLLAAMMLALVGCFATRHAGTVEEHGSTIETPATATPQTSPTTTKAEPTVASTPTTTATATPLSQCEGLSVIRTFAVTDSPDGWTASGDKLVFNPDGKILAVSVAAGVALYATESGALLHRLTFQQALPNASGTTYWRKGNHFSPDGQTLAVVYNIDDGKSFTRKGYVDLWDVATGTLLWTLSGASMEGSPYKTLSSVVFSPDSSRVVPLPSWGRVVLWASRSGKPAATFETNKDRQVLHAIFSADGDQLTITDVRGMTDGTLIALSLSGATGPLETASGEHFRLIASDDRKWLALSTDWVSSLSTHEGDITRVKETTVGTAMAQLVDNQTGLDGYLGAFRFSPSGKLLLKAVSGKFPGVTVWRTDGQQLLYYTADNGVEARGNYRFTPDDSRLYLLPESWPGHDAGGLDVVALSSGTRTHIPFTTRYTALSINREGTLLAAHGDTGEVQLLGCYFQ